MVLLTLELKMGSRRLLGTQPPKPGGMTIGCLYYSSGATTVSNLHSTLNKPVADVRIQGISDNRINRRMNCSPIDIQTVDIDRKDNRTVSIKRFVSGQTDQLTQAMKVRLRNEHQGIIAAAQVKNEQTLRIIAKQKQCRE